MQIDLEEDLCTLVLGRDDPEADAFLRPEIRAAIEQATVHRGGLAFRTVNVTREEARDLLECLRSRADALSIVPDGRSKIYADGFDNARYALRQAGYAS
jgi:hypothetical protein